jgi:exo-1,4-beta-D-glucosaminidase
MLNIIIEIKMKRFVITFALGTLACLCLTTSCKQGEKGILSAKVTLSSGWLLQSSSGMSQGGDLLSTATANVDGWYPVTLPSTVMGALTASGLYGDLFYGTNYKDADRTPFDVPWWYRTTFESPATDGGLHVKLLFEGLSYRANVWLNGRLIAAKEDIFGAFCLFEIDVTDYLNEDGNVLAVEVFRAQTGEPNIGFVDWNPRPLDENMGIFRDVRLIVTGAVEIKNTWVKSKVNKETLDEAWLTVETELANLTGNAIKGRLEGRIEDITFSIPVTLGEGESRLVAVTPAEVAKLHLRSPRLWWCNNMGSPELYNLNIRFVTGGQVSDEENIRFGIREIETILTEGDHKAYLLNGKKLLVKSAGWTDDIFLRDTPQSYETQISYVKDMNLNSIRLENVWGTGQSIYDLCDRYGLMVMVGWSCQWEWQGYFGAPDDRFGCIHSEEDMNLLVRYLTNQVRWLRNHPSIIAWFGGSDKLLDPELERRYMELWPQLAQFPYIGSAARRKSEVTGPSGMKMNGPYEYVGPSYWFTDTTAGGNYGFNTETGTGSQVPVYESLVKMIPPDKLWPLSEEWDYHTTASRSMNSMQPTVKAINAMYGKPADLVNFLNRAFLLNSQATQSMFEAFRINPGKATGIVQWMLNSAWPSVYWQLFDYYKVPVASYYGVKRGNSPLQLIYNYKDNAVYAVNETLADAPDLTAFISAYSEESKLLFEEKQSMSIAAESVRKIYDVDNTADNTFLFLSICDVGGNPVAGNFYCLSSKPDEYDWEKANWLVTPIKTYGDFAALAKLPEVKLKVSAATLTGTDNGLTVEINNPSETIALMVQFTITDASGEIPTPVFWSDNYVSLKPGEKKTLRCLYDSYIVSSTPASLKISGWNVSEQRIDLP